MTDRDRLIATILGQPTDRPPYWLYWAPWETGRQRWLKEGMPDIADHRTLFDPDLTPRALPVNCGPCPPIEPTVIEEDDEFVIHTDSWGIVRKDFKNHVSMSTFIEFPIKDRADWEQFKDRWLNPGDSVVVRPGGDVLAGPLHREQGILYADIEPGRAAEERRTLDVVGHYARNDVFQLVVDRAPREPISEPRRP